MSSVLDVSTITVAEQATENGFEPAEVIFTNSLEVQSIDISLESDVDTVEIVTEGPQGRPGLQNVFVSETNPALDENGNVVWGAEQKNFIWVKI